MRNAAHKKLSLTALALASPLHVSNRFAFVPPSSRNHAPPLLGGNMHRFGVDDLAQPERPSHSLKRRRSWAMEAGRAKKDDATFKKEKQRIRLQKRNERIVRRTRSLQALFPRFDATRMASRAPNLLSANSQRNIPARLAALKSHLPEVDVERMVRSGPDLLTYNVDKVLGPRISELRRLFPDFPRMVMVWPGILTHDVETFTVRKMRKLSELLPGIDVVRLVSRYPMMLSLDIEGNVKPRLEGLAQLLPGHDITAMIGKVPRLLGCDLTKIEQKVSSLRWLLGPEANLNKILRSNPDLMISNVETTVAAKLRLLQDLFPEAEVVSMVERDSKVLFYDIEGSVKVKVDCWRERVTNATELDEMLVAHPGILSNSLHVSVSRLDFLIETNSTEMSATQLFKVVKTRRKEWSEAHGDGYRTFLEQKVSGPPVLRLWPGLYFDNDPNSNGGDSRGQRERMKATMQGDDVVVQIGGGTKTNPAASDAQLKGLEKKYGTIIKEAQLRFSSALRVGTRGETPTEIDMVVYDLKKFDQQVRKLAMARRLKRFRELLPELKTDRLFTDYPNVMLMDLKKVEERIIGLRDLLGGRDVSAAVSIVPQILLSDVQLCLRPRMTRLIVALTRNQLEGALDANMVKNMVSRCPELLLADVRNVVVPSLQYVLSCTSDHDELGKRLYKDPSLLVVGVAPLARLQYSLEEHRRGVSFIPLGKTGSGYFLPAGEQSGSSGTADLAAPAGDSGDGAAGEQRREGTEDPTRLLPPLVVPQILKCKLRDFLDRNPEYPSFLAQRQGLQATKGEESDGSAAATVDGQRGDGIGAAGAARTERTPSFDESGGQVAFWERAVGARLSEKFRPLDSPYAREKLKMVERGEKGPEGQRVVVSELDLLIADVLYFNNRMRVLLEDKMRWVPQAVDVGQEAVKLAEDVEWASRQISRLLGLSSRSKGDRGSTSVEQGRVASLSSGSVQQQVQQRQQQQKQGSWISNALDTLKGLATGTVRDGNNALHVNLVVADPAGPGRRPQQAGARVMGAGADSDFEDDEMEAMEDIGRSRSDDCSLETAIELEKLLGEVSSFEDRLEGLLSNQASLADESTDGSRSSVRRGDAAGEKREDTYLEGNR